MKILLILFWTIAFVSANESPIWNQCGNSSDVFTPTSVTAQKDPKNQTQTLVSACGTVNSHGSVTIFNRLKVDQNFGFADIVENLSYRKVVPSGSEFCLNYTGDYSRYPPMDVLVQITAYNVRGDEAGCVNMTLRIPVPESKFLLERI